MATMLSVRQVTRCCCIWVAIALSAMLLTQFASPLTAQGLAAEVMLTRTDLKVSSPDFSAGGTLPVNFTCDGAGEPPIVRWSTPPTGTKSFMVLMETEPGPPRPGDPPTNSGDYSWTLYDIPAKVRSTAKKQGVTGHNSHNPELAYAPPCSQGPGEHTYTITVYALSRRLKVSAASANGDALKALAGTITLESASITTVATRS